MVLVVGCATFDGKVVPLDKQTAYKIPETATISLAPIQVFFDRPEVLDQDDEHDFTPILENFAGSLREALAGYFCHRGAFARCTAERHEGDYRLRVQVLVSNFRQARGGIALAVVGGLLLPPLLGMAWSFPVGMGSCEFGLTWVLEDPAGKEVWKRVVPPGGATGVCLDGQNLSAALKFNVEDIITELSAAALGAEQQAQKARDRLARPAVPAEPAAPARQEVLAVFDLQDSSKQLTDDVLVQLTDFLSTAMTATGRYSVVPREQLRGRLVDEKTKSYKVCYDAACQIELGKAVSAQKTLFVQLLKVGTKCSLVAKLYDLKTETAVAGATIPTGCEAEDLLESMGKVATQLTQTPR